MATETRKKSRPKKIMASRYAVSTSCLVKAAPATSTTARVVPEVARSLRLPGLMVLARLLVAGPVGKDLV